MNFRWR